MKKEVSVCIKGLHSNSDDAADMGIQVNGTYHLKDGKHYIRYAENAADEAEQSSSILKIMSNEVELIKKGYGATHLHFEPGKLNHTYYKTIMGNLFIGVDTSFLTVQESEDKISVRIEYALVMDGMKASDCVVEIEIASL
ncbi:MAG: DUF1934 domain-containing protein [Lachnospiraceae bacterium]|nr:DUF1934 domain-containing protein [Lachnospiraceae bacterium]